LVVAQQDDHGVSMAELPNLIVTLVFTAHDSTRHQLANASPHSTVWTTVRPSVTGGIKAG
jgi:hypothetical protein